VCVTADTTHRVSGLSNLREYRFRLCAANEDGASAPSEVVALRTSAGEPLAPTRLQARPLGASGTVRLSWQAPRDAGGADVLRYLVQVAPSAASPSQPQPVPWRDAYAGAERECTVHGLAPGLNYVFRVACETQAGLSRVTAAFPCFSNPLKLRTCNLFQLNTMNEPMRKWTFLTSSQATNVL